MPRSRRQLRRSGSASASSDTDLLALAVHNQGHFLVTCGSFSRGSGTIGRGDGGSQHRRAVAGGQRHRLLRRDPWVSGGVRGAARPGMDRRPDEVVSAATRHGRLHRPLSGAPSGDPALTGRLGRGVEGGAAGQPALRSGEQPTRCRRSRLSARGYPSAAGRFRRRRGRLPGGEPVRARAATRPRAHATGTGRSTPPRSPRSAGQLARRRSARSGRACCQPLWRSCWPSMTCRRPAGLPRAGRDRGGIRGRHAGCRGCAHQGGRG